MSELDLLIGKSQRDLSRATLVILVVVLGLLLVPPMFGAPPINQTVENILLVILGGVLGGYAAQNQFWFGRPRSAGVPDPIPAQIGTIERADKVVTAATAPSPSEKL